MPGEAPIEPLRADVAVVGAGAAGLYAALAASRAGMDVVLVSRSPLAESASYWAQGGIAAALAAEDSPEKHLDDTLIAGRGVSRESAARVLCEGSPACVHDLESLGVSFDADRSGALALGLEGGHSERRVVHAGGSATGRRITRDLSALVALDARIEVLERTSATALWVDEGRCMGLIAESVGGGRAAVTARGTVLATGGTAALWERTTNPRGATGAGMTLAHAAGADLADLEFVQFHPTALRQNGPHDGFLITEAVRGEGAPLVDRAGERFTEELAPRDQVALAVKRKLDSGDEVFLDMRAIDVGRFPNVVDALRRAGIDPVNTLVPVAPAAHYAMGGVATDLDGRSSLPGLYAVGETACTGLHGANRLASNSLAECFVFGRRAALRAADEPQPPRSPAELPATAPELTPPEETRARLWRSAGLEREPEALERMVREEPFPLARLIAASALARRESRGAHQRRDLPELDPGLDRIHLLVDAAEGLDRRAW